MELQFETLVYGSPGYEAMVELRRRVLRRPLGLDFTAEQLAAEAGDTHIGAFEGANLAGCLILTPQAEGEWKMRQVAVDADRQGQGIGKKLVAFAEDIVRNAGGRKITLHARETAVPFYLRLGYQVTGAPFEEVTLPHYAMWKSIEGD